MQATGGGVYVHSGVLHVDQTTVRDNMAAQGGGISLAGSSRLTASLSEFGGNRVSSVDGVGADLLLADGDDSAAYLDPVPEEGQLSGETRTCKPRAQPAVPFAAANWMRHGPPSRELALLLCTPLNVQWRGPGCGRWPCCK